MWKKHWGVTIQKNGRLSCLKNIIPLLIINTLTLMSLPKGRKHVYYKWVFKIKHGANGKVEWYNVRLVARSFTQTYE